MKRQYMGCAGRVANGINTVHLSYVREQVGHALIGARQWIPAEHIDDPATTDRMGLPTELVPALAGGVQCRDFAQGRALTCRYSRSWLRLTTNT